MIRRWLRRRLDRLCDPEAQARVLDVFADHPDRTWWPGWELIAAAAQPSERSVKAIGCLAARGVLEARTFHQGWPNEYRVVAPRGESDE